ncbi:MAG: hydroxymethylglutaryl-CoA lyase [Phycisphaerales bacterium]|nr:hydroxymethylglutaryl-CoA lyase [Phycisphaerales bacterium]
MDRVQICEMSPRDGLQSLGGPKTATRMIPAARKLQLIAALQEAGLPFIEAAAFVNPKVMPQMSDAEEVAAGIRPRPGCELAALVPNLKHYERFRASRFDTAAVFVSASEEYSRRNMGVSLDVAMGWAVEVCAAARADQRRLRAHLSGAFQDVITGEPADVATVARVTRTLLEAGCECVALADTNGETHPRLVRDVLRTLTRETDIRRLAIHLHDRCGAALANALAALDEGVRIFDAAVGGIGGSANAVSGGRPTAGNIATEELVDMFERMGVATGIHRDALTTAGRIVWDITRETHDPAPPSRLLREQLGYRLAWIEPQEAE